MTKPLFLQPLIQLVQDGNFYVLVGLIFVNWSLFFELSYSDLYQIYSVFPLWLKLIFFQLVILLLFLFKY